MIQTVYGDILFLVNFTMDFLTLYVTSSILKRRVSIKRFCLGAALGAFYGVASCFMKGPVILNLALNLAVSLLMCLIVFKKHVLPCLALLYGVGCLIGGVTTAFFTFIDGVSFDQATSGAYDAPVGEIPLGWMAVTAVVTAFAAIAGGRITKKRRAARDVRVAVVSHIGSFVFDGILDSGNLLTDPLSGREVIILRRREFLSILPPILRDFYAAGSPEKLTELNSEFAVSVRLVPSESIGGKKLLMCYLPKSISIDGEERSALIALGDGLDFDGRAALVPSVLA